MAGVRKLIVFDEDSARWVNKQKNGSLAIRNLIHSQILTLKTGRPKTKRVYIPLSQRKAPISVVNSIKKIKLGGFNHE